MDIHRGEEARQQNAVKVQQRVTENKHTIHQGKSDGKNQNRKSEARLSGTGEEQRQVG